MAEILNQGRPNSSQIGKLILKCDQCAWDQNGTNVGPERYQNGICMGQDGTKWDHLYQWDQSRTKVGLKWNQSGAMWDQNGICLGQHGTNGTSWNQSGTKVGPKRVRSGTRVGPNKTSVG